MKQLGLSLFTHFHKSLKHIDLQNVTLEEEGIKEFGLGMLEVLK